MIIVDAGYLAARSRYAFKDLTNSEGTPTGAVYGFLRTIQQIRRNYKDHQIIICMDSYCSWRPDLLSSYKSGRESRKADYMGSDKQKQHALEKAAIMSISSNIKNTEVVFAREAEADDLIALYASKNPDSIIYSADKDMWQLAQYGAKITSKINKGNFVYTNQPKDLDGVKPENLALYRAILGDTSDQIPKIKGLKSKEVLSICQTVSTLDEFIEKADELASEYNSAKVLIDNIEQLKINYEVCQLPSSHTPVVIKHLANKDLALQWIEGLNLSSMKGIID